jgi:hypothetical protein
MHTLASGALAVTAATDRTATVVLNIVGVLRKKTFITTRILSA